MGGMLRQTTTLGGTSDMAIFAKKQDAKRLDTQDKIETGGLNIRPAVNDSAVASAVGSTIASAASDPATGPTGAELATAGLAGAGDSSGPSGKVESAVSESVDIEAEVIDPEAVAIAAAADSAPALAFGIGDAIKLMRSLPNDGNVDLVVRVVRVTLGAVNVSVEEIMEDARRKERGIQASIAALDGQVAELEKELYARRCEIAAHQADLKETAGVRERLYQADKYTGHRPPPTPPDAARIPLSKLAEWGKSDQIKSG